MNAALEAAECKVGRQLNVRLAAKGNQSDAGVLRYLDIG